MGIGPNPSEFVLLYKSPICAINMSLKARNHLEWFPRQFLILLQELYSSENKKLIVPSEKNELKI